jgi:hypothetical protein
MQINLMNTYIFSLFQHEQDQRPKPTACKRPHDDRQACSDEKRFRPSSSHQPQAVQSSRTFTKERAAHRPSAQSSRLRVSPEDPPFTTYPVIYSRLDMHAQGNPQEMTTVHTFNRVLTAQQPACTSQFTSIPMQPPFTQPAGSHGRPSKPIRPSTLLPDHASSPHFLNCNNIAPSQFMQFPFLLPSLNLDPSSSLLSGPRGYDMFRTHLHPDYQQSYMYPGIASSLPLMMSSPLPFNPLLFPLQKHHVPCQTHAKDLPLGIDPVTSVSTST